MSAYESLASLMAAFAAGIGTHILLFRNGEWDLSTVRIIQVAALVYMAGVCGLVYQSPEGTGIFEALRRVAILALSLISGIFGSMLIYRGFFHRLCGFPGPFLARFSNFYLTSLSAKNIQLFLEVQQLHKKYGDIVRLGPSELSINKAEAVAAIHSSQSTCTKGPFYNAFDPMVSMHMMRDKKEHTSRRRVWDRGFSVKALREYDPTITSYAENLFAHVESTQGMPINVSDWFNFYSFDVMGELAWGKTFGMMESGVKHYFLEALHASMTNLGLFRHIMWLFPIFKQTPILNAEEKSFWKWLAGQVQERKTMTRDRRDVFSWLLEEHNSKKPTARDELLLLGDAHLVAVTGSDTSATALTCIFFELSTNPACLRDLQTEVDKAFELDPNPDYLALAKLPYLNAIINETLRMYPVVPSGVQRMTDSQGLQVGDTFIPPNTIVQIPTYTMFKDERFFTKPDDFIPERWTSNPSLVRDASVFVPFSTGSYSCIGKQLGLMELRHVVSHLVRRYNVALAPGQTKEAFLADRKDTFAMPAPKLSLVFSLRSKPDNGVKL